MTLCDPYIQTCCMPIDLSNLPKYYTKKRIKEYKQTIIINRIKFLHDALSGDRCHDIKNHSRHKGIINKVMKNLLKEALKNVK